MGATVVGDGMTTTWSTFSTCSTTTGVASVAEPPPAPLNPRMSTPPMAAYERAPIAMVIVPAKAAARATRRSIMVGTSPSGVDAERTGMG